MYFFVGDTYILVTFLNFFVGIKQTNTYKMRFLAFLSSFLSNIVD